MNAVQLLMNAASGSPSGFSVSIYGNSTWADVLRQPSYQFAIFTTPTPEPQTYQLAALALAGFALRRFRPGR